MFNSTTNTYTLKREILTFSGKVSKSLSKPDRKFTVDMTYGMLAANSCLLTDVARQLHEDTKALISYLKIIRNWVPSEPVIHIDDSDVVKPIG